MPPLSKPPPPPRRKAQPKSQAPLLKGQPPAPGPPRSGAPPVGPPGPQARGLEFDVEGQEPRRPPPPPLPGQMPHRCTDVAWLFVFLVALGGFAACYGYAAQHGDVRHLTHGADYKGRTCGVDVPEEFLFWCTRANGTGLEFKYPICISSCPTSSSTSHECFNPASGALGGVADYPSKTVGHFCLPQQTNMGKQVMRRLVEPGAASFMGQKVVALYQARMPVLFGVAASCVVGCLYLLLLGTCTRLVLYLSLCPMFAIPMYGGKCMIQHAIATYHNGMDGPTHVVMGCGLLLVGAFFFALALGLSQRLSNAIGYIRATCDCMFQEPSLLLQPFVDLAVRAAVLVASGEGLVLLVSCGTHGQRGLRKVFDPSPLEQGMIVFYVFMVMWFLEACSALSQYVLAWVTQTWYFTPYVKGTKAVGAKLGIFKALGSAFRYHLGTIVAGSFLTLALRLPRALLDQLSRVCPACGRRPAKGPPGVLQRMRSLNRDAYMDVALSSTSYCAAAGRSQEILNKEHGTVFAMQMSQALFVFVGYTVISSAGAACAWFAVHGLAKYSREDSVLFVSDPLFVAVAAGVLSLLIAVTWMIVFDMVGDTILYCFLMDETRKSTQHNQQAAAAKAAAEAEAANQEENATLLGWIVGNSIQCVYPEEDDDSEDDDAGDSYTPYALHAIAKMHHHSTS